MGRPGLPPVRIPRPDPSFAEGSPVEIGSTFIGLTTRKVWGPPGGDPSPAAGDRPATIYLDCDDGSVRLFAAESPWSWLATRRMRWSAASAKRSVMPAT